MASTVALRHPNVTWLCPALAASPKQAIDDVLAATDDWPRETMAVMGSSLGGFYATWLVERFGCKAVLLNPAVKPARDLKLQVGVQTLWHAPDQNFVFEPAFVEALRALEVPHISRPDRYFAVIAKGDEVLDWQEMLAHYPDAKVKLLRGGDHALSDFDQHLEQILQFLDLL